ncbi:hypothetical protein OEZ85_000715 [Tetradesmus obliquus]|uniref:SWIM-type domain-containing protein n=1 Tax=Tetradesmus obliquus TaxID=3088 RepID=A0ABY8UMK0_TETOB|nr:hypothetical protein OEZ85_000715 [Tetradesmus obliquus]
MAEVVLNEFELQRQQLIARNRARLLALGIPEAVSGLAKLAPKQAQHKKRKTPQAAAKTAAEPAAPSRQSTRLRDQAMVARGEVPPDVEQGSELALFIIDGECPRCGKVLSSSHARHLQSCKGPPEPPTEEEIAAQAESYKLQQKDKLRQLELGGLVDYQPASSSSEQQQQQQEDEQASPAKRRKTEQQQQQQDAQEAGGEAVGIAKEHQQGKRKGKQAKRSTGKGSKAGQKKDAAAAAAAGGDAGDGAHATFIVIGSTGNHYVVKLSDDKRSCTCMDHRMRRRDCKHIRLVWEQLAVADAPQQWEQALQRMVSQLAAAEPADVDMVRQAEARAAARKERAEAAAAAKAAAEV